MVDFTDNSEGSHLNILSPNLMKYVRGTCGIPLSIPALPNFNAIKKFETEVRQIFKCGQDLFLNCLCTLKRCKSS